MIVNSMTHEEVYQELERDRESLTNWWWHRKEELIRPILKRKTFPVWLWYDHVSPRKNRYIVCTRIFDRRMKAILTGIIAVHHSPDGLVAYTTWLGHQKLVSPMVLTPHMFKRYAERCKVRKSGIELVKHYFSNNAWGEDTDNQGVVGRSVRYNGEEHLSCCVTDGVLLGQRQGGLFIARTFITYDMCCGRQQQEFESKRKDIKTDREVYNEARKYY